jgi:hypothetical protein
VLALTHDQPARRVEAEALLAIQAPDRCHQAVIPAPDLEAGERLAAALAPPVERGEPPLAVKAAKRTHPRAQPLDDGIARLILDRLDQPDRVGAVGQDKP